jgi:AmmeMemoRadiSam system protein B
MQGTVTEPDLNGLDTTARAVLVHEGPRQAWIYDPTRSAATLVAEAARAADVRHPARALVVSLAAASTQGRASMTDVPSPQSGPKVREAAVAGSFYPSSLADINRTIQELLPDGAARPEPWPAVMVPHAGWRFSGKIAAAVYARVAIPHVVIVLAPRHYRQGMEWAVAPHDIWSLPGTSVASDVALARDLCDAIPGLELDAVAHEREHSIEVQLPLIARLAPHARVVGLAFGAGNLDECRRVAAGLAAVLRGRREKPLLIMSTDLNHYASDAENRRLDAIALAAIERRDPGDVYRTVREHKISMCGLIPTVVGMETLRRLDQLSTAERVAYGTSADASGDTSRVVGYAGMLFR